MLNKQRYGGIAPGGAGYVKIAGLVAKVSIKAVTVASLARYSCNPLSIALKSAILIFLP